MGVQAHASLEKFDLTVQFGRILQLILIFSIWIIVGTLLCSVCNISVENNLVHPAWSVEKAGSTVCW